ncbi:MAG: hypothetical protein AAB316_08985, partial [Bacteroidota bacterium]
MKLSFGFRFTSFSIICFAISIWWIYSRLTRTPSELQEHEFREVIVIGLSLITAGILILFGYLLGLRQMFQSRMRTKTLVLYTVLLLVPLLICAFRFGIIGAGDIQGNDLKLIALNFFLPLAVAVGLPYLRYKWETFKDSRFYRKTFMLVRRGSARLAGLSTYKKHAFSPKGYYNFITLNMAKAFYHIMSLFTDGTPRPFALKDPGLRDDKVFLGRSSFDNDPFMKLIGVKVDTHLVTISMQWS